jgi:hypothetical protein
MSFIVGDDVFDCFFDGNDVVFLKKGILWEERTEVHPFPIKKGVLMIYR